MMERRGWKLLWIAPAALLAMALFTALGGWVVRSLWNWLLPPLFGWPVITFWQALGLLILCRILFGGFGLHGGPGRRAGMRVRGRGKGMTREERERLRQKMGERFGFGPPTGEGPRESV